jgi:hypothetical protein
MSGGGFDFDFNTAQVPMDERLTPKADAALRSALAAVNRSGAHPREKAIAAIEAADALLSDLLPAYAHQLSSSLAATAAELRELDELGANGPITERVPVSHSPGTSRGEIARQARAVLAHLLLLKRGKSPREAATWLAAEGYASKYEKIEGWVSYFQRDTNGRRKQILAELSEAFETRLLEELGRTVQSATAEEIVAWLRPRKH